MPVRVRECPSDGHLRSGPPWIPENARPDSGAIVGDGDVLEQQEVGGGYQRVGLGCRATRNRVSSSACFSFVFALGLPTFGAECRFIAVFQTVHRHAAKVGN